MTQAEQSIYPQTRERIQRRARGLLSPDGLVISALVVVVCLVSLPRLAHYVRRTNERDALVALELLGPACFPAGAVSPVGDPSDLSEWGRTLRHRLGDARPLEEGSTLLYHGYLFALRPTQAGEIWLTAWPRQSDRTGNGVFAWSPTRGALRALEGHRDRWTGVVGDPEPIADAEWLSLGDPAGGSVSSRGPR